MASTGIVAALQAALAAENAAIFGYGVAGAHLTGSSQAAAEQDWTGHNQARDTLAAMISARGAAPAAARAYYQLPFRVHDAASATRLAAHLSGSPGNGSACTVGSASTSYRPPARKALNRWKISACPARVAATCSPPRAMPFSMFQARVALTWSRWAHSSGAIAAILAARSTWKTSSASASAGAASVTAHPASSSDRR